eukprot:5376048-Karenia_brevis.AAC.1
MMIPNGRGSYVLKVDFAGGGPTEITVDSGAEESVCPWEWGGRCLAVGVLRAGQAEPVRPWLTEVNPM